MKISLTDFVEFVALSGGKKLTKVREIKNRGAYHPRTDFYKTIRERIISVHQNNGDLADVSSAAERARDATKKKHFMKVSEAYSKFCGKKKFGWFDPPKKNWNHSELDVILNPELGLIIKGEPHIIKLYFKNIPIERDRVNSVICLMENELSDNIPAGTKFAVLDILRSKLYYRDKRRVDYMPLIIGEAESFISMWGRV